MRAVVCHLLFLALLTLAYVASLHGGTPDLADSYDAHRTLLKTILFLSVVAADAMVLWLGPARTARALRTFLHRRPRLAGLLAGMAITALLLVVAEGVCRIVRRIWPAASAVEDTFTGRWNEPDPMLGFRHSPGVSVDVTRVHCRDGRALYTAHYTIDADGHRATPTAEPRHRIAAFFGCSFTFGAGLADGETIPARFCGAAHDCAAVNFACCGYGTSHMLRLLDTAQPRFLGTQPHPPLGVYTFIDHHLLRNAGSLRVVDGAGAHFPCYALDDDGHPVLQGTFHSARPVRSLVYWLLGKSQLLDATGFDWPPAGDRDSVDLTAALVAASRQRFTALTGSDLFFVVLYPGSHLGGKVMEKVADKTMKCLDYSGLFDADAKEMNLGDGHPSAQAARLVGEQLAHDVESMLH